MANSESSTSTVSTTASAERLIRLIPSERRQRIKQMIVEQNVLKVSELSVVFGVSEMTIRRDLESLEEAGHLERRFGGAIAPEQDEQAAFDSNYDVRLETQTLQKAAIARHAATLVSDGDTIAIDASTTALMFAKEIANRPVTIITNSLDTAQALRHAETKVILTGGYLRQSAGSFLGPLAIQSLQNLKVDLSFVSAKALLIPDGLMDSDLDEAELKRVLLSTSAKSIALIDSSKFGKRALVRVDKLASIDLLISDTELALELQDDLERTSVAFNLAEV